MSEFLIGQPPFAFHAAGQEAFGRDDSGESIFGSVTPITVRCDLRRARRNQG